MLRPKVHNTAWHQIRAYHEGFLMLYANLSDIGLAVNRQVAEGDTVVTHMTTSGKHSGEFLGFPATGATLAVDTIRIDKFQKGKILEHWSVTDMAGLLAQLQGETLSGATRRRTRLGVYLTRWS